MNGRGGGGSDYVSSSVTFKYCLILTIKRTWQNLCLLSFLSQQHSWAGTPIPNHCHTKTDQSEQVYIEPYQSSVTVLFGKNVNI